MPDLIAELEAYRAEQARYAREGRKERAAAAGKEAERVADSIKAEVEKLDARAGNHEEAGQDLLAAQARVEARRLRRAVAGQAPAEETAVDTTPRETATTRRGGRNA
jgi:hypothetical protein